MRQAFLEGMSRAAATVSVITTDGPAGRAGLTVSAMSAVSADTPTPALLVCVHHRSPAAEAIRENGVFCVNVLRDDQATISDTFAGRIKTPSGDKFDCGGWRVLKTGAPALDQPLVAFDCHLKKHFQYGTHWIFIGELAAIALPDEGSALVYANRTYSRPVALQRTARRAAGGAEMLAIGCLVTLAPSLLPDLLGGFLGARRPLEVRLVEGDQTQLLEALASGEADLVLTYDDDPGPAFEVDRLREVRPFALVAGGDPRAGRTVSLADLAEEPMILLDLPRTRDYVLGLFEAAGLRPNVAWRSTSAEMVSSLVANGFGYAVSLTEPAGRLSEDGKPLAVAPLAEPVAAARLVVARRRGERPSQTARAFIEHCREHFGVPA
jgi:flavin reductase (DIM6/NTAB) family NADH-FMN oxidoreductase RutF